MFEFRVTDGSAQLRLALYQGEDGTVRERLFDDAKKTTTFSSAWGRHYLPARCSCMKGKTS